MPVALSSKIVSTITKTRNVERKKKRFKVEINPRLCKGCYFCLRFCPAGVFSRSGEIGELGYVIAKVEHPEKCTGCRLCLIYCPDFATSVEEEREKK
jgi:2-oxoglutarate ferredoxin oxidoreductase subunit delta